MKKLISILIVLIVLSAGCVSKNTKSDNNKTNKDEYSDDDGSLEEDDSGVILSQYDSLDLNNKNLSDGSNITKENITQGYKP